MRQAKSHRFGIAAVMIVTLMLSFMVACSKKKINSSEKAETRSDIMRSLNTKDPQTALYLIEAEMQHENSPEDKSELLYLKASALAMKAGIDIYKLYPLLEMKIFRESAVNWKTLSKSENPYSKYFDFDTQSIKLNVNNKLKERIREKLKGLKEDFSGYNEIEFDEVIKLVNKIDEKYLGGNLFISEEEKTRYKSLLEKFEELKNTRQDLILQIKNLGGEYRNISNEANEDLSRKLVEAELGISETKDEITRVVNHNVERREESLDETLASNENEAENKNKYDFEIDGEVIKESAMDIIWGIYQSLPMFSLIPSIEEENITYLDEAITILIQLTKEGSGFKNNEPSYYLSFLSAIGLLNIIKKSLSSDELSIDPLLFVCNFEENVLYQNYQNMKFYIKGLATGAASLGLPEKSKKLLNSIAGVFERVEDVDGNFSEYSQKVLTSAVEKFQEDLCF